MTDLNRTIAPVFNVFLNEDNELVAESEHEQFAGTQIHLDEPTAQNLSEKLMIWLAVQYQIINDMASPERIFITETKESTADFPVYKARIMAPA